MKFPCAWAITVRFPAILPTSAYFLLSHPCFSLLSFPWHIRVLFCSSDPDPFPLQIYFLFLFFLQPHFCLSHSTPYLLVTHFFFLFRIASFNFRAFFIPPFSLSFFTSRSILQLIFLLLSSPFLSFFLSFSIKHLVSEKFGFNGTKSSRKKWLCCVNLLNEKEYILLNMLMNISIIYIYLSACLPSFDYTSQLAIRRKIGGWRLYCVFRRKWKLTQPPGGGVLLIDVNKIFFSYVK